MSERESGYLIKARIWVPADPQDPQSMAEAARWVQNVEAVTDLNHGIAQLEIYGEPKFHARREVPTALVADAQFAEVSETEADKAAERAIENDPPIPPEPRRLVPRPAPNPD